VRLWDQPSDIEQLDRDEASASLTGCILRLAGMAELVVRTSLPNEGHASIRLDCREGIVGDLDRNQGSGGEEGRLANIWLANEAEFHRIGNDMVLEVP